MFPVVDDRPVIRLFRFRPVHREFDHILRTEMLPDLRRIPGLVDVHVGRHGSDALGDRIVGSVWSSRGAMVAGIGESLTQSIFHPERIPGHHRPACSRSTSSRSGSASSCRRHATILRLFRGGVRPGELDGLRRGGPGSARIADDEVGRGPNAIYLAPVEPDRFITMSLWPSWDAVQTATGGDVHRPIVTKDPRRIVDMDVVHYEVIPADADDRTP